ncbi:MAG: hypothetical protein GX568_05300 [Candidatus Gastranaerophilales bacterium]|nr:hypothetical protein [Candidatus Gastranaerophilales bacterium]
MALPNIFGQNVKNPLQAINAQNNAQVANKNPEQIAQAPVSIFGANPPQNDIGARAQEIITKVQKMHKLNNLV